MANLTDARPARPGGSKWFTDDEPPVFKIGKYAGHSIEEVAASVQDFNGDNAWREPGDVTSYLEWMLAEVDLTPSERMIVEEYL